MFLYSIVLTESFISVGHKYYSAETTKLPVIFHYEVIIIIFLSFRCLAAFITTTIKNRMLGCIVYFKNSAHVCISNSLLLLFHKLQSPIWSTYIIIHFINYTVFYLYIRSRISVCVKYSESKLFSNFPTIQSAKCYFR